MAAIIDRDPWNKGKLVGQKAPFKLKEIWAIRVRLQLGNRHRELALFNLGIDNKLRACDLIKLRVRDITHGTAVAARAIVMQQKTQRPVQFEITDQTKESLVAWIRAAALKPEDYLFPSRRAASSERHLSTRQYARIVHTWGRRDWHSTRRCMIHVIALELIGIGRLGIRLRLFRCNDNMECTHEHHV